MKTLNRPIENTRLVVPAVDLLDALSPAAKEWLRQTCERFAEGEGYDDRPPK